MRQRLEDGNEWEDHGLPGGRDAPRGGCWLLGSRSLDDAVPGRGARRVFAVAVCTGHPRSPKFASDIEALFDRRADGVVRVGCRAADGCALSLVGFSR